MIEIPEQVEVIREKAAAELQMVSDLEGQIEDAEIRLRLRQIRSWLDEIGTFLAVNPSRESRWLTHAEMLLQIVSRERRVLQNLFSKQGYEK